MALTRSHIAYLGELEADRNEVATSQALSGELTIEGRSRDLKIQRGYRRKGEVEFVQETELALDDESWPEFVELVLALDRKCKALEALSR